VGKPQTPPRRLAPESDPSDTSLEGGCGVSLWWAEELRFKPTDVLQVKRPFCKWRDPDSNRGHHDFQLG
jgi:hypothetical protein